MSRGSSPCCQGTSSSPAPPLESAWWAQGSAWRSKWKELVASEISSSNAKAAALPPAEGRGHVGEDGVEHVGVVVHSQLVGHRQQQRVGGGDGFVRGELVDEFVWLTGVGLAESGEATFQVPHLIGAASVPPEQSAVQIGDQREDRPAHRHPRMPVVACLLPRFVEQVNLFGL